MNIKRKTTVVLSILFVLLAIVLAVFATGGIPFSVFPTQGYENSLQWQGAVADYHARTTSCEQLDPTIIGFALTNMPKEYYDLEINKEKSYMRVVVVSTIAGQQWVGHEARTGLEYIKIGENPYAVVRGTGLNNFGWVYGIRGDVGNLVLTTTGLIGQGVITGTCNFIYHVEFNQPSSCTPNTICGEWSQCSGGSQSRTCDDGCGQVTTETKSCTVGTNPPPIQNPACPQVAEPSCQFYEKPFVQRDLSGCTVVSTCQADQNQIFLIVLTVVLIVALSVVYIIVTQKKNR